MAKHKVKWIVGDNMPGYMPDNEPFEADSWAHAKQCLRSTIYSDSQSDDYEEAIEDDYSEAIAALDRLPQGQEFGYTVNHRHYWITKA